MCMYDEEFKIKILINFDLTRNHRKLYMMYTTGDDMFNAEHGRIGSKLTLHQYNRREWTTRYNQKINGRGYVDINVPEPFKPVMLKNISSINPDYEGKKGIVLPRYIIKDNDQLLRYPPDAVYTEVMLANAQRISIMSANLWGADESFLVNPTTLRQGIFKQFYEKIESYKGRLPVIIWD